MVLNKDNWEPLAGAHQAQGQGSPVKRWNWSALDPALGVPLLHGMVNNGHADDFGMPVIVQQAKLPTDLTLPELDPRHTTRHDTTYLPRK
jgi:hypothetical protein